MVGLPAETSCYPRVCLLAKRQVTYSSREKKMRSHLAIGRCFDNAHEIFQTRDIRDKIEAVKFSSLVRGWSGGWSGGLVSWVVSQAASGR